jgi:hypothetical protein
LLCVAEAQVVFDTFPQPGDAMFIVASAWSW